MSLSLCVAAAFALAPLIGWVGGLRAPRTAALVALLPLLLFVTMALQAPGVAAGADMQESRHWVPSLGISASFRLDGLSLAFALLITGIGTAVFLYASAYLRGEPRLTRFFTVLALFMASMLGAVLADDLLLLVVFWELTSLTSFLLIGYSPEQAESRRSAQQGLLITVAGGLALLAGVIVLGRIAGTWSISAILEQREAIAAHPAAPAVILLVAAGAFAKSAQAPLHAWLANAMVAPTPVSAYLHSATMVKLGVYLLARLDPVFSEHTLWIALLTGFGALTMATGAVLALRETDLKRLLAYSTIVTLGTLTLLVGLPGERAAVAVVTLLVAHALYKACLFLVAGIVDHETGTRDSRVLGGLRHRMPLTAAVALLGGLSMAGLPPFLGFTAKELLYESGLAAPAAALLTTVALLAQAAMAVVAAIVALRCFWGPATATPRAAHEVHDPGPAMLAGPMVLAVLGLVFGLAPGLLGAGLVVPAAGAIVGMPVNYTLALWHGLTPALLLSALTLTVALVLYTRRDGLRRLLGGAGFITRYGPDRGYDRALHALVNLARWQTQRLQSGSLRIYLGRTFVVLAVAAAGTLLWRGGWQAPDLSQAFAPQALIAVLMVVAALAVTVARNFVTGIVAAGMVGFAVALLFLFQGAPDLAFTQFSVEALAMVIFLAIVGRMPFRERDYRTAPQRRHDVLIAVALGVAATLVLMAVLAQPFDPRLSDFFRAASVPEAQGRNLVNVIIVDFRALDTLGEITVLGLAAIAAAAVVAGLRHTPREPRA